MSKKSEFWDISEWPQWKREYAKRMKEEGKKQSKKMQYYNRSGWPRDIPKGKGKEEDT